MILFSVDDDFIFEIEHSVTQEKVNNTINDCLQPDKGPKPVLLVVPSEAGQPAHSSHKGSHDRHGHGAFSQSISQLCLKHASKHRQSVESKWKVCEEI